jgi:nucleoside-triphosphatase THEP1
VERGRAAGIGKTAVIRRVAEAPQGLKLGGFYTEELREAEKRDCR